MAPVVLLLWGCGSEGAEADAKCESGFSEVAGVCQDVDECSLGTHTCWGRASCVNKEGAFYCACPQGWQSVGSTCALADCKVRYQQGHGDLYVTWRDDSGLSTALRADLGAAASPKLHATSDVCIEVPRASYDEVVELGGRPPEDEWAPIGVGAGEPFWYLPEVAIEGRPWFGLASDPSELGGVSPDRLGPTMTLSIAVEAPPGAALSMWVTGETGSATFRLSTANRLTATELVTGSHAHMSWGFTKVGEYLVDAVVTGTRPDGQQVRSAPSTLRFVVR